MASKKNWAEAFPPKRLALIFLSMAPSAALLEFRPLSMTASQVAATAFPLVFYGWRRVIGAV